MIDTLAIIISLVMTNFHFVCISGANIMINFYIEAKIANGQTINFFIYQFTYTVKKLIYE